MAEDEAIKTLYRLYKRVITLETERIHNERHNNSWCLYPFMPYLKEPRVTNWQHQISPYDINTEFWESVMRINEMII